jgi:hypothetical protein
MPIILATWEAEIKEDHGSKPAWAKNKKDPISINSWLWWCVPDIPAIMGSMK